MAHYQLPTRIFLLCQSYGLAVHPHPIHGICGSPLFLISGFCIHYANTSGKARPCWKTYLIRRILENLSRIFCRLGIDRWYKLPLPNHLGDKTWDVSKIFRVATLTQNYPPGNGQLLSNPSLWTIPLEIEFYLLYPLAFLFFSSNRNYHLLLLAFVISGFSILLSYNGYLWLSFTALFLWPKLVGWSMDCKALSRP